ncbi:MAG: type II secretion system F family protein [Candidatus Sericytochromatia bacterium]
MNGLVTAPLSLAAALLVLPRSGRHRLIAAGLGTPRRWLVPSGARAATVCVVAAVAVVVVPLAVALAAGMLAATLLMRRRRHALRKRAEQEVGALEAALDVLVGELRTGAHPVAAFQTAAGESSGAVAASLHAVAARALLGADVAAGLRSAGAATARPAYWDRLAVYWQLAQTHGLTLATLLRAAQRDVVERSQFDSKVRAGMAGARATAAVLAGLPLAGVALGEMLGAHPVGFLLSRGAGGWLLLGGTALVCCGLLWSDRITGRALS